MLPNEMKDIKRAERLIALTQQSGWDDLLKILDNMWQDAHEIIMSASMHNGGMEKVIEARATMKVVSDFVHRVNNQIAFGEMMREKIRPKIER